MDRDPVPTDLRRDVRLLGEMLGQVLAEAVGPGLVDDVERLRAATAAARADPARSGEVVAIVEDLSLRRAEQVARAFTVYFQLVNIAEERSRVRRLVERSRERWPLPNSLPAAVESIRESEGPEVLDDLLERLEIRPVLTAHPTEARRRAVVETLKAIAEELALLDDPRLSPWDERESRRRLLEQIETLWETDQLRAQKPTPLDEVRAVMALFDETIFWAAPAVYRELDHALGPDAGARPAAFRPFLRWGSWVGGDRDGNPSVTADVTREAARIQSDHALAALEETARWLGGALSASTREVPATPELTAAMDADGHVFPEEAAALERWMPDTPHRRMLLLAAERLAATRAGAHGAYAEPDGFIDDLRLVQRSLAAGGASRLAYGELQHLIWQAETFGFHLASIDVRQHSSVHEAVLAELGVPLDAHALDALAAEGWPEAAAPSSERGREALETLLAIEEVRDRLGPHACGRYVVSFTRSAADILAVHALARLAVPDGMDLAVLPLLESRDDLDRATDILDELISLPWFSHQLESRGRRIEVMLGYSDSAKEVGMLAANLALYEAQGRMAAWSRRTGVEVTLFHGRGGALGRGGGPTNRAIWAQAPGSVGGRFQVTEQGEVIFARYANPKVAHRHLEQVASAVLLNSTPAAESGAGRPEPFADAAARMAEASEDAWRALVETQGFAEFFANATPLAEIEALRIASRPSRRSTATDVASLRAIPWVFAWSQCRANLPGWFGLGSGLEAVASQSDGQRTLRAMYDEWPFFTTLLDNAALSLVKADLPIARLFLARGHRPDLVDAISAEADRTEKMILLASDQERLLARWERLRTDIELRNPYVDALSFLQLRWLPVSRRDDLDPDEAAQVERLVHLTINGVAAGLQNTG